MIYDAVNSNVKLAGQLFLNQKIVIYPTDTLYGFGVDVTNTKAIDLLNKIKKRNSPLSIIVSSIEMLKSYAILDENMLSLIEEILPGSFTLLLKASPLFKKTLYEKYFYLNIVLYLFN